MLSLPMRLAARPWRRPGRILLRCASSQHPPPARPYRPQTDEERAALRRPDPESEPTPQPPRSSTRRLLSKIFNPFHEPDPAPPQPPAEPAAREPPNPERGIAAAQRYVKEGFLDPKYKAASRRYIAIIIGTVIAVGLTPEVWRRTAEGGKRKELPQLGRKEEMDEETAVDDEDGKKEEP